MPKHETFTTINTIALDKVTGGARTTKDLVDGAGNSGRKDGRTGGNKPR